MAALRPQQGPAWPLCVPPRPARPQRPLLAGPGCTSPRGCAYLRPPPAPPRTGEKGEQPPPPTRTSTSPSRRLAPPPPPSAGPPPPHWARPLPVRAGGGPLRRPALRERQGETGPAAGRRAAPPAPHPRAAAGCPSYPPGEGRDGSGAGGGGRQRRARATSVVGREDGACENPALCALRGAGGAGLSRCLKARAAHASYWLLGCAGFWGALREESGRAPAPPTPEPPAVGAGAAPLAPPAPPGKCGGSAVGRAGRGEGARPLRGAAVRDPQPASASPQRPSGPRPGGGRVDFLRCKL